MDIGNRRDSEPLPFGFEPRPHESLRGRLIHGVIWFALSILPASVDFPEIVADAPHAIVEDDDTPRPDIREVVSSLASAR